ncbi:hypothetical protein NP493_1675g00000 [Ridgeia piscesae]|uniref:Uncharacterized protein n=1 Tax=Ridgeia piscesae TaxID=27915 RepID=A0AAD9N7S7_RIDPI|nr:hypothetical protein NP493_1675g00000 [Ridgeia piscesae]
MKTNGERSFCQLLFIFITVICKLAIVTIKYTDCGETMLNDVCRLGMFRSVQNIDSSEVYRVLRYSVQC